MRDLTSEEWAYLAGFFDGDGCVNIAVNSSNKDAATPTHYLQVILAQSDEPFLREWRDRLNIGSLHELQTQPNAPIKRTKPCWAWRICGQEAERFLRMILPYVRRKAKEVEIALEFRKTKKDVVKCMGTPPSMLALRQYYLEALQAAKRDGEPPQDPQAQQLARMLDSQLVLF